jgi:hypothetical protein
VVLPAVLHLAGQFQFLHCHPAVDRNGKERWLVRAHGAGTHYFTCQRAVEPTYTQQHQWPPPTQQSQPSVSASPPPSHGAQQSLHRGPWLSVPVMATQPSWHCRSGLPRQGVLLHACCHGRRSGCQGRSPDTPPRWHRYNVCYTLPENMGPLHQGNARVRKTDFIRTKGAKKVRSHSSCPRAKDRY